MIIEAGSLNTDKIEADICIIGAGAAGLTLSSELSNSPFSVVILEGGSIEPRKEDQKFYTCETTELPLGTPSRVRAFGGTTNVWTGGWKLLDPDDFTIRDWLPFSGWPVTRKKLEPYYDRAAQLVGGPRIDESKQRLTDQFINTDILQTTVLRILPSSQWNFGHKFKSKLQSIENVRVILGANTTRLILNDKGGELSRAVVKTSQGKEFTLKAKYFVLACGGVENARLLLFSQVGNQYDQVGRYYMDHPKGTAGRITLNQTGPGLPSYLGPRDSRVLGIQLAPQYRAEHRLLNSYIQLLPIYSNNSLVSRALRRLSFFSNCSVVSIRNFMEQAPSPNNRVALSIKKDPFGNPLAKVSWSIYEFDKKSLSALHQAVVKEFKRLGIGEVVSPLLFDTAQDWPVTSDASHHLGTTRMGSEPRFSVTDADCRVHEVNNLFVTGSSLFPTGGHANPTATIIALAIRLADKLKTLL